MNFLQLQQELQALTLDDSTAYAAWGATNKVCINRWYEDCFREALSDENVRNYLASYPQSTLTAVGKVAALPTDFERMYQVSLIPFKDDSQIDDTFLFWDYKIVYNAWVPTINLKDDFSTNLYYRYIKKRADLSADLDIPVLPESLHRSIVDYARAYYFETIRDFASYQIYMVNAEARLRDRLEKLIFIQ